MDANQIKEAAEKAIKQVDLSKIKPGFKTSEFYLIAGTVVSAFLLAAFKIPVDPTTLGGVFALAGAYLAKRWDLKRRAN